MYQPSDINIREIETLEAFIAQGRSLGRCAIQGLDLGRLDVDWREVDAEGALFLGCKFRSVEDELAVIERGAYVLRKLKGLPYDPHRPALYTPAELLAGCDGDEDRSLDARISAHFRKHGGASGHLPHIKEALAQRLHDHAIDDALGDLLRSDADGKPRRKVVGIMGGHQNNRSTPSYRSTAELARMLARAGYFVASGGGSGAMEAANLGAYLAPFDDEALDRSIEVLKTAAEPGHGDNAALRNFHRRAIDVLEHFPGGGESLGVPTWFYDQEPTNHFATHIAKYFSNSIREDGLLAISLHGVVFAPGSAGTRQEVFQDAAQNHYATFGRCSPMAFLGVEHFGGTPGDREAPGPPKLFPFLRSVANANYRDLLFVSDDPAAILAFIREHGPRPPVA